MTHKERKEEVREILALDTNELVKRVKGQLILSCEDGFTATLLLPLA